MRLRFGFALLMWWLPVGAAPGADEFERVNQLRRQAGLPVLVHDAILEEAAARHAAYLDRHRRPGERGQALSAHAQAPGLEPFSGEDPVARALAAGYPHRVVLENVSMGFADPASAIDGLMGAIYHRLTFLDLEADQLGAAVGERSRVFLLGRSDITGLCRSPPPEALSRAPVDCVGRPVRAERFAALCAHLPAEALFRPAHPVSCPNGVRLDADFMAAVCARPPPEARFAGRGRFYQPCDDGTPLDAQWFDRLCEAPPVAAAYTASGLYYRICSETRRVSAEWLEAWCAALPEEALDRDSGRYRRPCADDSEIRVEYLRALDAARQEALPEIVVWPPAGAREVPPAFFIEDPDPLPDLALSGYPVSVQFNPGRAGGVELKGLRLFRVDGPGRIAVGPVRLLQRSSDPNQLLSEYEFALFPLERLAWETTFVPSYRVEQGSPQ